ncbi:MAG: FAD-dependent oxidoreductase [Dehalococcoidia bacterium]|nr:FAD-dependent oxidoreductase [Dehalococcoidia bacterium]
MKVCIVGGGGGASNAANVIRSLDKQAQIDIFTNRGEMGNLPCEIPFVLKGVLSSWESSFAFRDKFYEERNIEVHLNTEVTEIIREHKRLMAGGISYSYDKAILDLGASPIIPPILGLDGCNEFVLTSGLNQARIFENAIPKYSRAAIIGVGQIALEVASILKEKSYREIYLIGRSDRVLRAYLDKDMAAVVEDKVREKGMELILSAEIVKIATCENGKVLSLADRDLEIDFVFFATSTEPNTKSAQKADIRIGETGAIAVNEYLQTSDPDIYAIGDCMENWERITGTKTCYQTATNAARTGRIAGKNLALGNVVRYPGTVMPFVTEIFGYQVGMVGFTETQARERGLDVVSSITTTSTRRRLFGGKPIHIKLIADRRTRSLVGAQLIGEELVAGKIDRLAVAIAEKIPVDRLSLLDTCYSPTTGAGYEAVTMALDELEGKLA